MWAGEKKNCYAQPFSPDLSATSWLKVFISSVIICFSSFWGTISLYSVSELPALDWLTIVVNRGGCCHSQLFPSQDGARSPWLSTPRKMWYNLRPRPLYLQENPWQVQRYIQRRTSPIHSSIQNIWNQDIVTSANNATNTSPPSPTNSSSHPSPLIALYTN